jgi:hypothetical protein
MHRKFLVICACALVLPASASIISGGLASGSGSSATAPPAKEARHPNAKAEQLATHFFELLKHKNVPALRHFMSPAYKLERADGTGSGKKRYLSGDIADINKFHLSRFHASAVNGVIAVRYLANVKGTVHGQPYTPGNAPRLSTFAFNGKRWQIVSHANFNPLKG